MDSALKLICTLIILTIVVTYSTGLISSFTGYATVRLLSNDINNIGEVMRSLRELGSTGSWRQVSINVPDNYTLFFNNVSDSLDVSGAETLSVAFNSDVLYELNLSSGTHLVQLYYGALAFNDVKNETVVFQ